MTKELHLPGIQKHIEEMERDAKSHQEQVEDAKRFKKEQTAKILRIRKAEYEYLLNSPLIEVLKEAGKRLRKISSSPVKLSITKPGELGVQMNLKLIWNMRPTGAGWGDWDQIAVRLGTDSMGPSWLDNTLLETDGTEFTHLRYWDVADRPGLNFISTSGLSKDEIMTGVDLAVSNKSHVSDGKFSLFWPYLPGRKNIRIPGAFLGVI